MTDHEATAKRLLPCECGSYLHQGFGLHRSLCGFHKWEAVAAALAAAEAKGAEFRRIQQSDLIKCYESEGVRQRQEIAELKAERDELENPMQCGHYGANSQPDDSNNYICMVCAEIAELKAAFDKANAEKTPNE